MIYINLQHYLDEHRLYMIHILHNSYSVRLYSVFDPKYKSSFIKFIRFEPKFNHLSNQIFMRYMDRNE